MTAKDMQKRSWKKRLESRGYDNVRAELSSAAKKSGAKQLALKGPEYYRAIRQKGVEKQRERAAALKRARPMTSAEKSALWRKRHPEKKKVQQAVFIALRNGTLQRQPCHCGDEASEAHHEDYSKPLEVIWLCKKHHAEADKLRRREARKNLTTAST